jgi:hypothetical protein
MNNHKVVQLSGATVGLGGVFRVQILISKLAILTAVMFSSVCLSLCENSGILPQIRQTSLYFYILSSFCLLIFFLFDAL